MAVNSKGHIFVYSRGGSSHGPAFGNTASQLLEFDPDGKYIREIGKNLYAWSFAHTVRIDKDDNIWADRQGLGHDRQVRSRRPVLMVFGRKQEASDDDAEPLEHPNPPLPPEDGRFRQPTDVTWDSAGNTFISDGYINSRVAKLDKDGNWIMSLGEPGNGPGSSTPRTASRPTRRTTSMSPTAAIAASRCSTPTATSARDQDRRPAAADDAHAADRQQAQPDRLSAERRHHDAGRALGDLHHAAAEPGALQRRCVSGPHLQDELDGKVLGCSARPASSPSNSAGSTRSPARPRTCSMSPRS